MQLSLFLQNFLTGLGSFALTAGGRILAAAVILIVGFLVVGKVLKTLEKSRAFAKMDKTPRTFLIGFLNVVLKALLILTAATILGVPMTNIVAIVGSCGLAVGLAMQGSLANLAGGLMILIFKPFKVGDFIEANGFMGTVESISVLYTELVTPDNRKVVAPNGSLSNATVVNYSAKDTRRMDFDVSVSFGSDADAVRKALLDLASSAEGVLGDPAPAVNISAYNESSVTFTLRVWVDSAKYWDVHFALRNGAEKALADNGVKIPFPQLDVHVKND